MTTEIMNASALEIFLTVLGAMGGWGLIQYLLDWIKTRKSTKSKDCSEDFNNQFSIYKDQISFLGDQLKYISETTAEQIKLLNQQVDEKDDRISALSLKLKEMEKSINELLQENQDFKKRLCLKYDCSSREK